MPSWAWTASKTCGGVVGDVGGIGAEDELGGAFDGAVVGLPALGLLELRVLQPLDARHRRCAGRCFDFG